MEELNRELEDIPDITDEDKNQIRNLYSCWKNSQNKRVIIENVHNQIFVLSPNNYDISQTVHLVNCQNTTILVQSKLNHFLLEASSNVKITFLNGLVGSADILHSQNITVTVLNQPVNYFDLSNSSNIHLHIHPDLTEDFLMTTCNSVYVYLHICKKYCLPSSLFYNFLSTAFIDDRLVIFQGGHMKQI